MRIGLRTIKTCIAIWLCAMTVVLILVIAKQFDSSFTWNKVNSQIYNPFFAGLAAAYSVHQNRKKSLVQAKNRGVASIIGGLYAILIVLVFDFTIDKWLPGVKDSTGFVNYSVLNYTIKYTIFAILAIFLIQFTLAIHQPDMTFIAILTYIAVVVSGQTALYGFVRILSTLWGVLIALIINVIAIPRRKNKHSLFVVGLDGFTFKDGAKLPGYETFKINQLIAKDAYVVFYTSRTPGSFASLTNSIDVNSPVILMNGAGVYDFHTKKYLYTCDMERNSAIEVKNILKKYDVTPFENVIKDDLLYIFNKSITNEAEEIYANMRKNSPYTTYVVGENVIHDSTTYLVVINETSLIKKIIEDLDKSSINDTISYHVYDFVGVVGYSFLKIYSSNVSKLDSVGILKEYYNLDKVVALGCKNTDEELFKISDKSYICDTEIIRTNHSTKNMVRYKKSIEKEFRGFAKEYNRK